VAGMSTKSRRDVRMQHVFGTICYGFTKLVRGYRSRCVLIYGTMVTERALSWNHSCTQIVYIQHLIAYITNYHKAGFIAENDRFTTAQP